MTGAGHGGESVRTQWLAMPDGEPLFIRDWPCASARDAVLIVHGLGEHSGRHEHLAQWFLARGCAVRSYDQRGHGQTPGRRGALAHADDLPRDLAVVYRDFAARRGREPWLLGHSMGGAVALRAVLDGRIAPPALILSSPALRAYASPMLRRLAHGLARVLPNLPLPNGLKLDKLSHEQRVIDAYRSDSLCHGWVTPRLADFILRAGESGIADAWRLDVPTLLLAAGSDSLVDPSGSRDFAAAAWATHKLTSRFFDTLYHELFNESEQGRHQVLAQLAEWLRRVASNA